MQNASSGEKRHPKPFLNPKPLPAVHFMYVNRGKDNRSSIRYLAGATHRHRNGVGPRRRIPNGQRSLGRPGLADEKPVHEVLLDGFWIGRYPITVAQYAMFTNAVKSHEPVWLETDSDFNIFTGTNPLYKDLGSSITGDNYPITGISWNDATAFTRWLSELTGHNFRLPTEAEWEYAAPQRWQRGKIRRRKRCDGRWPGTRITARAMLTRWAPNNPTGWAFTTCAATCASGARICTRKRAYRQHRLHNPLITENGSCRVVRGGSWQYGARDVRCADRGLFVPNIAAVIWDFGSSGQHRSYLTIVFSPTPMCSRDTTHNSIQKMHRINR